MLFKLAFCLALVLPDLGGLAPSIALHLSGRVRFGGERAMEQVAGLRLFVKADGHVVARTNVDDTGRYAISFTPAGERSFDFYYTGLGHDTTLIKSFTRFESDVMVWDMVL